MRVSREEIFETDTKCTENTIVSLVSLASLVSLVSLVSSTFIDIFYASQVN